MTPLTELVIGLNPHVTSDTVSINRARRLIAAFSKPLKDISHLILENISMIEDQREDIDTDDQQNSTKELVKPKHGMEQEDVVSNESQRVIMINFRPSWQVTVG